MDEKIQLIYADLGDVWLHTETLISQLQQRGYSWEESYQAVSDAVKSGELVGSSGNDGFYRLNN